VLPSRFPCRYHASKAAIAGASKALDASPIASRQNELSLADLLA